MRAIVGARALALAMSVRDVYSRRCRREPARSARKESTALAFGQSVKVPNESVSTSLLLVVVRQSYEFSRAVLSSSSSVLSPTQPPCPAAGVTRCSWTLHTFWSLSLHSFLQVDANNSFPREDALHFIDSSRTPHPRLGGSIKRRGIF